MIDTALVKQYVADHLSTIRGREDVAAALGLDLEALRRTFLKREGLTLAMYIRQERVEQAKLILRQTTLNNKEVCAAVGFARREDGERTFREVAGVPMQAYRARHRERYDRR